MTPAERKVLALATEMVLAARKRWELSGRMEALAEAVDALAHERAQEDLLEFTTGAAALANLGRSAWPPQHWYRVGLQTPNGHWWTAWVDPRTSWVSPTCDGMPKRSYTLFPRDTLVGLWERRGGRLEEEFPTMDHLLDVYPDAWILSEATTWNHVLGWIT